MWELENFSLSLFTVWELEVRKSEIGWFAGTEGVPQPSPVEKENPKEVHRTSDSRPLQVSTNVLEGLASHRYSKTNFHFSW